MPKIRIPHGSIFFFLITCLHDYWRDLLEPSYLSTLPPASPQPSKTEISSLCFSYNNLHVTSLPAADIDELSSWAWLFSVSAFLFPRLLCKSIYLVHVMLKCCLLTLFHVICIVVIGYRLTLFAT